MTKAIDFEVDDTHFLKLLLYVGPHKLILLGILRDGYRIVFQVNQQGKLLCFR